MKKIAFHCECGERLVVPTTHVGPAVCSQCDLENDVPGLSNARNPPAPSPQPRSPASTGKMKSERRHTGRQKTLTGRHSMRRPVGSSNNWMPLAAGGGVLLLVLIGVVMMLSSSSGNSSSPGGGSQQVAVDEARIKAFVNEQTERREAYLKTYEQEAENELASNPVGDPRGDRTKLAQALRKLTRAKFPKAPKGEVDDLVDAVLAVWGKGQSGATGPRRGPEKRSNPLKQQTWTAGKMPTESEVRLFLDGMKEKKEYMAACYKAVHFKQSGAREWWEDRRAQAANTMRLNVKLRFKGTEPKKLSDTQLKQLNEIVGKILGEWRRSGEVTAPPEIKQPPKDDPPSRQPPPRQQPPREPIRDNPPKPSLDKRVSDYLASQADLKNDVQGLVRKYGRNLSPGLNAETRAFHNKLMGRVQAKFPNESSDRLVPSIRRQMGVWIQQARR